MLILVSIKYAVALLVRIAAMIVCSTIKGGDIAFFWAERKTLKIVPTLTHVGSFGTICSTLWWAGIELPGNGIDLRLKEPATVA